MSKRVLVTGGAGFIGSHVCESFLEHGYEVHALDNLVSGKRENVPAKATLHVGDIRGEEAQTLIRSRDFNVIVHLAAQMDVRKSVADPVYDADVNIQGTLNLIEGARALPKARWPRIVFASSGGAVYGDFVTPPNSETAPKDPESPYAISKLSVEYYLAYYARVHGLETASMRFANVYGPRQDPHGEAGVVAIFVGRIRDGKPLTVFGAGTQTRDYVYVGDVASAVYAAATTTSLPKAERLDARAFNVGTGVATSVIDLAKAMMRTAGRDVPLEHAPARPGEQQQSVVDIAKTRAQLSWWPAVSLEQGLAKTYAWFGAIASRR